MIETLFLVLAGFAAGLLAGMFGIGGGILLVPSMVMLFSIPIKEAIGTSLLVIIPTAAFGFIKHMERRGANLQIVFILIAGGMLGAYAGALATGVVNSQTLELLFQFFIIVISAVMLIRRKNLIKMQEDCSNLKLNSFRFVVLFSGSFLIGILSGLLGVGGGTLLVPFLVIYLRMPLRQAIAYSLLAIFFNALSGVFAHISLGNVNFEIALYLLLGSIGGVQLGSSFSKKIPEEKLHVLAAVFFILVALSLSLK